MNVRREQGPGAGVGRNVLVVALYVLAPSEAEGAARVLVVAPLQDTARVRASERAAMVVDLLERRGARAEGRVGDSNPLQSIVDALETFAADEIVIAIPPHVPRRRADGLLEAARRRFALPVRRATAAEPLPYAA